MSTPSGEAQTVRREGNEYMRQVIVANGSLTQLWASEDYTGEIGADAALRAALVEVRALWPAPVVMAGSRAVDQALDVQDGRGNVVGHIVREA